MTDRDACIVLNLISGIGSVRLKSMCEVFGSPAAIFQQTKSSLKNIPNINETLADCIVGWREKVDFENEVCLAKKSGVKIITQVDSEYPAILKEIHDSPLCLYVKGELPDMDNNSLAIVGSRRVTNYGKRMAEHLAESAAYAGWTVVSGLAYGTDAIAHKATLAAGGKTVAVLGGGLTRVHPQDHVPLARSIIDSGAVISEFPMEFSPNRRSFPMRNRVISGLSRGVLIIEAGINSGSLITSNFALEQGRSVFAVPGQADNPQARGCNSLIKQGAKLTETFDDIIEEFEFLPGFSGGDKKCVESDSSDEDIKRNSIINSLSEEENRILERLSLEDMSVDMIADRTGIPSGKLLALLMKLEMNKLVVQLPGKNYTVRKGAGK